MDVFPKSSTYLPMIERVNPFCTPGVKLRMYYGKVKITVAFNAKTMFAQYLEKFMIDSHFM